MHIKVLNVIQKSCFERQHKICSWVQKKTNWNYKLAFTHQADRLYITQPIIKPLCLLPWGERCKLLLIVANTFCLDILLNVWGVGPPIIILKGYDLFCAVDYELLWKSPKMGPFFVCYFQKVFGIFVESFC